MSDTPCPLSDEAFQKYVRDHFNWRLSCLPDESLMPYLWLISVDQDGKEGLIMCALAMPFNEAREKQDCLYGIGRRVYADKKLILGVILSVEAWISKNRETEPRHDPERKEAVITVGARMQDTKAMMISVLAKRDEKNQIVVDGEPTESMDAQFSLLTWFWRGYFYKAVSQS